MASSSQAQRRPLTPKMSNRGASAALAYCSSTVVEVDSVEANIFQPGVVVRSGGQRSAKVVWQWRSQIHVGARDRVTEAKPRRVQEVSMRRERHHAPSAT